MCTSISKIIFLKCVFKKNRSEVKQSGWFTTSQNTDDEEITQERKTVTPEPSTPLRRSVPVIRTTRITTPHPPERQTPQNPTRPIPRTVHHTTQELKVYSSNPTQDENSPVSLPPTTTALAIKKPVR